MKIILLFLIFFLSEIFAYSYNFNSDSTTKSISKEINYTITSGNNLIKSITSSDNTSYKIAYGCILATTFFFDNPIYKSDIKEQFPNLRKPINIFKYPGEIKLIAPISLATYGLGYFLDNNKIYEIGRDLTNSLFFTGIITTTIKTLTGRSRPFTNDGPTKYKFFQTKFNYTSFPSGHTAIAFTIAKVLSNHLDNDFISLILYTMATGTAFERIYSNNHWLSDVVLSSIIAYNIGDIISNKKNNDNSIFIYPDFKNYGFALLIKL